MKALELCHMLLPDVDAGGRALIVHHRMDDLLTK
jgi:hypothetical protein